MRLYLLSFIMLTVSILNAQTKEQAAEIAQKTDVEFLTEFAQNEMVKSVQQKKEAIALAKINNWPITYTNEKGGLCELQKIVDGKPFYYTTHNDKAAKSTRATVLHNGGTLGLNIEGQDMTAYVWDAGRARDTHNEFNLGDGNSKVTYGDNGSVTVSPDHATHVSGTIAAIGDQPTAKGTAPQSSIVSYDWNSDLSETATAAAGGMLISNHSYGAQIESLSDWRIGAYVSASRQWDNVLFAAPYYTLVTSAGNDGNDAGSNGDPMEANNLYDKLSIINTCKNSIVVANGNDLFTNNNGDILSSMSLSSSSSQGPTDDYRVKPDITGNGVNVFSSISTSDAAYGVFSGTSMAGPNVAGSLLLLQQLYNQENSTFALSATIKGLALHTADDDSVEGPDAKFGWGYMNTKAAADVILSTTSLLEEVTLNEYSSYTFDVVSDGTSPLVASISWRDPSANNVNFGNANRTDPVLVNDLDIRLTKNGTTYYPWKLTGVDSNEKADNIVDPFEKIEIANASGTYSVTINHKDDLKFDIQNFSLIITGITTNNFASVASNVLDNVMIWPNPSNGKININLDSFNNTTIKIVNILGKSVFLKQFDSNVSNNSIDLQHLDNGIYIITIEQDSKIFTKKIILN